jgi:hypothetical protein
MLCEKHGIEMEYKGEAGMVGYDIWECYLCESEMSESYEDGAYGTDGIEEFYDLGDDSAAGFDDGIDGRTIYKNHQPPEVLPVISWLEDDDDDVDYSDIPY